ncbi:glucose 1-dehydrogenase [Variovorax paradoxus]|nr:glucose 1-dehydrogenase [Variovorax paradoxus]MBT2301935.1 glucose 1-dehydrogenase [Variovorax paradoxus]
MEFGRRFAGQVCVVTGAARGIGESIVRRLAQEGGKVAALDVSERRLTPTVEALRAEGLDVRGFACDVGSREQVRATMAAVQAQFDAAVAVLVNNAVWARFGPLATLDEETVDRTLAVGLKGLMWTLQAALPQMQQRGGGAIVNLSSTSALHPTTEAIVYAAMKAGVLGLTRAAAVELSPHRIRVNAILPGMVGTPASKAQYDPATLADREAGMPLGRFGDPQDIAAAVAFLASADGAYVQGAQLFVDGGWTVGVV